MVPRRQIKLVVVPIGGAHRHVSRGHCLAGGGRRGKARFQGGLTSEVNLLFLPVITGYPRGRAAWLHVHGAR